jgi:hypothetical protein
MPVVSVSYRTNQIMNLAGEKLTTKQMEEACAYLGKCMGTRIKEFCIDTDQDRPDPNYTVYIETEMGKSTNDAKCSEILDKALQDKISAYSKARNSGALSEVKVISLRRGAFRSFGAYLSKSGYRMEQNRPLKIITTDDQRAFFEKKAEE